MTSTFRYLDLAVDKQLLHHLPVPLVQTSVMHADPKCQRQLQVGVPHRGDDILDLDTDGRIHQSPNTLM